jgi:DNA-binding transcriptional LysR family regulator
LFPGSLRVFYEAVTTGSIRRASDILGLAPSSVSRQIAILEREMGTALLERSVGGVTPTHAGRMVADYARSVILDYDSLRADLNDLRGKRRGLIRIAVVEIMICESSGEAIRAFRVTNPDVSFQVQMLSAARVSEAVQRGECDVGITFCQPPHPDINVAARVVDPIVLVVPPRHPFGDAAVVPVEAMQVLPLALLEADLGVRRLADQVAHEAGFKLQPVLRSDSVEALRHFVRNGVGAALLTRRAVKRDEDEGRLHSLDIDHPLFQTSTIDVITLRSRRSSRLLRSFVDGLISTLGRLD